MFFCFKAFWWGMLSDRIGRKPILLSGLTGLSISITGFGLQTSFTGLVVARCFAGIMNGIHTIDAYLKFGIVLMWYFNLNRCSHIFYIRKRGYREGECRIPWMATSIIRRRGSTLLTRTVCFGRNNRCDQQSSVSRVHFCNDVLSRQVVPDLLASLRVKLLI